MITEVPSTSAVWWPEEVAYCTAVDLRPGSSNLRTFTDLSELTDMELEHFQERLFYYRDRNGEMRRLEEARWWDGVVIG